MTPVRGQGDCGGNRVFGGVKSAGASAGRH